MQEVVNFQGPYVCMSLYDWGYLEDAALFVIARIEVSFWSCCLSDDFSPLPNLLTQATPHDIFKFTNVYRLNYYFPKGFFHWLRILHFEPK